MANENKEIGNIVKKCKILLLDIEGTTTSISFVKDKLFPYAEENVKQFLDTQWEKEDVKEAVTALRKMALEDQESSVEGVVTIPGEDASKEEQIEGLVGNVKWQMSSDRKAGPLKQLQGLIWKQGYDSGDIKGHVYDDVSPALEQWHSVDGQKVYIYSSGSVQAQKLLFGQSLAGDLLGYIDGHFDTAVGAKQDAASYKNIAEKIGCKTEEILFLTDILKEAEAARTAGLHAALVSREGNAPLPAGHGFPVIHSLAELTLSNKRKPEEIQEEQPTKVPKTVADDDVKSSASEADLTEAPAAEETAETEKMEVEEEVDTEKESEPIKEEVVVEEVNDIVEPVAEVIEVTDPVVLEENEEKTEDKETEKMAVEKDVAEEVVKTAEAPVPEETPPTVITEIEEVSDKQLNDVAEVIEDVEPVIEEPTTTEDIEELQNVGEVLEKECDEILSKVQDVTNLDNIPIKPLLNPIAEEMETENNDSNDIVDKILDTELEMEMKQCEDIELNTVSDLPGDLEDEKMPEDSNVEEKDKVDKDSQMETETVTEARKAEETQKPEDENKDEKVVESEKKSSAQVDNVAEATAKGNTETVTDGVSSVDQETPTEAEVDSVKEPETEPITAEVKPNEESTKEVEKESQVNGKTNGDAKEALNGDASKEEELKARLAVENGDSVVNGANGDSLDGEKGQGDAKVEAEVSEIKVKTVTTDETLTEPTEQPTEA